MREFGVPLCRRNGTPGLRFVAPLCQEQPVSSPLPSSVCLLGPFVGDLGRRRTAVCPGGRSDGEGRHAGFLPPAVRFDVDGDGVGEYEAVEEVNDTYLAGAPLKCQVIGGHSVELR